MRWTDLAFLHWPVDPAMLRPLIPAQLPIDTFDGQAWVGIVPFQMEDTRPRFTPAIPGISAFPELNVRTYVRVGDRAGVWFFSFDAASLLAVRGARALYNLAYFDAEMTIERRGEGVAYRSERVHANAPSARFRAVYEPTGPVYQAKPGTLDHFLVERYCLFNMNRSGEAGYIDIHHPPWPLQPAVATIELNTMALAAGITLPDTPPLVHFARSLQVLVWTHETL
jgi:uncharacterized protein YqjF (DUF2071 family)